jgi:hypothetical protein
MDWRIFGLIDICMVEMILTQSDGYILAKKNYF